MLEMLERIHEQAERRLDAMGKHLPQVAPEVAPVAWQVPSWQAPAGWQGRHGVQEQGGHDGSGE